MAGWFVSLLLLSLVPAMAPTAEADYGATFTSELKILEAGAPGTAWQTYNVATHGRIVPGDKVHFYWNLTWSNSGCTGVGGGAGAVTLVAAGQRLDLSALGAGSTETAADVSSTSATSAMVHKEWTVLTATINNTAVDNGISPNERDGATTSLRYELRCDNPTTDPLAGRVDYAASPAFGVDTRPPTLVVKQPFWDNATNPYVHAQTPALTPHHPLGVGTKLSVWVFANDSAGVKDVTLDFTRIGGTAVVLPVPAGTTAFSTNYTYTVPLGTGTDRTQTSVSVHVNDTAGNRVDDARWLFDLDNTPPTATLTGLQGFLIRRADVTDASFKWDNAAPNTRAQARLGVSATYPGGVPGSPTAITGPESWSSIPTAALGLTDPLLGPLNVSLVPVDAAGNVGANATLAQVTDLLYLHNFTYGEPAGTPPIVAGTRFGYVNMTVVAPPGVPPPRHEDVRLTLELVGKGYYIVGTGNGAADTHFTYNTGLNAPNTTWRAAPGNFTSVPNAAFYSFPHFIGKAFKDGTYVLNITVNGTDIDGILGSYVPNYTSFNVTFKVDSDGPVIVNAPANYTFGLRPETLAVHMGDNNPVQVALNVTEMRSDGRDTGIANITVELTDLQERAVAVLADGSLARYTITATDCTLASPKLPGCVTAYSSAAPLKRDHATHNFFAANLSQFQGFVNTTFPGLAVGDYKVRVIARDVAGNEKFHVFGKTNANEIYKVRPRVALLNAGGLPMADATGVSVVALASYDTGSVYPTGVCIAGTYTCRVEEVTLQIKREGSATPVELGTIYAPHGTVQQGAYAFTGAKGATLGSYGVLTNATIQQKYYNFTASSTSVRFQYPGNFDRTGVLQIRAIARVRGADGLMYEGVSNWTQLASPEAPLLNIRQPPTNWWINTTQVVPYNVSFQLTGTTTFVPQTELTLWRTDGGAPAMVGAAQTLSDPTNKNPRFWNYTGQLTAGSLAPGEYNMSIRVTDGSTTYALAERQFAVAPMPTVNFTGVFPASNVYFDGTTYFVNRSFDIPVSIGHEAANVTSDASLSFELKPTFRPPGGIERYTPGDGSGFSVTIRQPVGYSPLVNRTNLRLTVTLPATADDGEGFILNVTATTDAQMPGIPYLAYNGVGLASLRYDASGPAVGVDRLETNATGLRTDGQLRFVGFATDASSGTREVQVRVYDVKNNRTLIFDGAPVYTEAGETNRFATSLPVKISGTESFRTVRLDNVSGQTRWAIESARQKHDANGNPIAGQFFSPAHEFDRNATYRVDVRAVDNLGHVSLISSETVQFDPQAPILSAADLNTKPSGIFGPSIVDWHGNPGSTDVLIVNASDNNCVARVGLKGIAPSGAFVGPVSFTPVTPGCYPGQLTEWRIDLSTYPIMTNEITNATSRYVYWFEAEDGAGRITEVPGFRRTFEMEVRDVTPALVNNVILEPALAAAGSTTRVVARVTENAGIDRVEVTVVRDSDGKVVVKDARLREDPNRPAAINGTGYYIADTDSDLNLSLEVGTYTFYVRATDINAARTCQNVPCAEATSILRVSEDAPPAVIIEVPSRDTLVINGTPTFQLRVVDRTIEPATIRVSAGNSTENLTTVVPTFTPRLATNGSRLGWDVTYKPPAFEEPTNFTLKVEAKSNRTGFTNTSVFSFRVDPSAPAITHNVTGTAVIANKTWATSATRITLNATDESGGAVAVTYTINRGAPAPYTGPISPLTATTADGEWRLDYTAIDSAGNVRTGALTLLVDRTGPTITVAKHGDEVVLTIGDGNGVGVDDTNITAHYAYGTASAFTTKKVEPLTGNSYHVALGGDANETGLKYWFQARDALGNIGTRYNASSPHVIPKGDEAITQNLDPTVRITSPTQGAAVRDLVDLRWIAEDPEGQPLTITIAIRDPAPGRVLVPGGENSGSYRFNLTGQPAGPYTVVMTASDGVKSTLSTVTFTLERGRVVEPVETPPPSPPANAALNFAVSINPVGKTVATATYQVQRDNSNFATGALRQTAQGTWAGQVTPTQPGAYRILVAVTYTDGSSEAPAQVASFTVAGAPEDAPMALPTSLLTLLVLGALTVALAAYGAFVRWK